MFDKLWVWCRESATILWARIQMFGSILIAGFAAIEWAPLVNVGLSLKQWLMLAGTLFLQGVATEIARRRTL